MIASLRDPTIRQQAIDHLRACDPLLAPVITGKPLSFKAPRESMFTHLLRIIIAQQVSVAAANAITDRVLELMKTTASGTGAEHLVACDREQLLSCGLSRPKYGYLMDLAEGIVEGRHRLGRLGGLSDDDVLQRLTAIRGIGVWSAEMVLMFRLHRCDILPTLDIGLRRSMERLYGLDDQLKPKEFHVAATEIAQPWQPYRSLATRYLWAALDGDITY